MNGATIPPSVTFINGLTGSDTADERPSHRAGWALMGLVAKAC
jgi:hypothetical protein